MKIKEQNDVDDIKEFKIHLEIKVKEINSLLKKIELFKDKLAESEKNGKILSKLCESGVIDEHGIPQRIREVEN